MPEPSPPPPSVLDIVARAGIALIPGSSISEGASIIYTGMRDRHRARADEVTTAAIGDTAPAKVEARLIASPELDAALLAAVQADAASSLQAKRRLLGRVINKAVLDDALVDEATLIVSVLAQIEAPHVRCLEAVHRAERDAEAAGEVEARAPGAERATVARIYEAGHAHPAPVLFVLGSLGLLEVDGMGALTFMVKGMTPFGFSLLADLRQA